MTAYALKWIAASLIMPLMVLLFGKAINNVLVLVFWPGSFALMSLGSEEKPLSDVVYVWGIAVGLNVLLYLIVGMVIYFFLKMTKGA